MTKIEFELMGYATGPEGVGVEVIVRLRAGPEQAESFRQMCAASGMGPLERLEWLLNDPNPLEVLEAEFDGLASAQDFMMAASAGRDGWLPEVDGCESAADSLAGLPLDLVGLGVPEEVAHRAVGIYQQAWQAADLRDGRLARDFVREADLLLVTHLQDAKARYKQKVAEPPSHETISTDDGSVGGLALELKEDGFIGEASAMTSRNSDS